MLRCFVTRTLPLQGRECRAEATRLVEGPQRVEDPERALEKLTRRGAISGGARDLGLIHEGPGDLVAGSDLLEDAHGVFQMTRGPGGIIRDEALAEEPLRHPFDVPVAELPGRRQHLSGPGPSRGKLPETQVGLRQPVRGAVAWLPP